MESSWPGVGLSGGTGFFISPKTVVTAAHCIYDPDRKDKNGNITKGRGLTMDLLRRGLSFV
ncbi:MAG: trypsin-like serine protease [Clostridiales bacterium]|jgi:V8-like Glu-specific endopeptidase|nr:trypsin-like serine protease [Clostridiales bacterium]